jgi:hypothetical protein
MHHEALAIDVGDLQKESLLQQNFSLFYNQYIMKVASFPHHVKLL